MGREGARVGVPFLSMRIINAHRMRQYDCCSELLTPGDYASVSRRSPDAKRPTNVTLRWDLLTAAREEGLNLSALLERALTDELTERKRRGWRLANMQAIAAYNEHVGKHGPAFRAARRTC
jgi:antitoxin CcdA